MWRNFRANAEGQGPDSGRGEDGIWERVPRVASQGDLVRHCVPVTVDPLFAQAESFSALGSERWLSAFFVVRTNGCHLC